MLYLFTTLSVIRREAIQVERLSSPVPFGIASKDKPSGFYKTRWGTRKTEILYCDRCDCPLRDGLCVGCDLLPYRCVRDVCDDLDRLGRKFP